MQDGQQSKRITKGAMDHVPKIKNRLGLGEEQYAFV
jgi:hypothetical protein